MRGLGLGLGIGPNLRGFSPLQQGDVVLWLRADDPAITLVSGKVSLWPDKSGLGNNATQSTAASRPTFTASAINGLSGVTGTNGTAVSMSLPANCFSSLSEGEIFVVAKNNVANPAGFHEIGSSGVGNWYPYLDGSIYDDCGSTQRRPFTTAENLNAPHLFNAITRLSEWTCNINGTQVFTTSGNTVGWATNPIILNGGLTGSYGGSIGEFLVFAKKRTTAQRAQLKSYFSSFWGITLV